jgi:hypothetical protein
MTAYIANASTAHGDQASTRETSANMLGPHVIPNVKKLLIEIHMENVANIPVVADLERVLMAGYDCRILETASK